MGIRGLCISPEKPRMSVGELPTRATKAKELWKERKKYISLAPCRDWKEKFIFNDLP